MSALRQWLSKCIPTSGQVLDASALRAEATQRTGLTDFGDPAYEDPLARLLVSATEDADLDAIGRALIHRAVVGNLANRLRFVDARQRATQSLSEPPRRPLIIAALPRTGSTLLLQLLASHPEALSLPLWLAMRPLPPPRKEDWPKGDSRRRQAVLTSLAVRTFAPDQMRKHPVLADGRVECSHLQMSTFESLQWWGLCQVHGYAAWLDTRPLDEPYRWLKEHLQLLQADLPGNHWVLKSPAHFLRLDTVLRTFPRARVVMLHRDPVKVLASTFSLLSSGHAMTSPRPDSERLAARNLESLVSGADRVVEVRKHADPNQFLDVGYGELVRDPIGTVSRIHRWAELPHDAKVDQAVRRALKENPPDRFGRHTYSADGADAAIVRKRFSQYSERFAREIEC